VVRSARYLADHMADVPAMVLACIEGRAEGRPPSGAAALYGSIVPAVWSFMLAARLRGLGTAYTTLHINSEQEIAAALGIHTNVTPRRRYSRWRTIPVSRSAPPSVCRWSRSCTGTSGPVAIKRFWESMHASDVYAGHPRQEQRWRTRPYSPMTVCDDVGPGRRVLGLYAHPYSVMHVCGRSSAPHETFL